MLEEVSMYCDKDVKLPIFFDWKKQSNNVHEISQHFSWNRYVVLKMFEFFFSPLYLVCTERVSLKMKYLYMYFKMTVSTCGKATQIY